MENYKNKIIILQSILLVPFLVNAAGHHTPLDSTGYTLVWSDEFNKDGRPDTANWTYE